MKIEYYDFLIKVQNKIWEYLPNSNDLKINLLQVSKNNGIYLDGLTFINKNKSDKSCHPIIYLNDYYAKYLSGVPLDKIIKEIANLYIANCNINNNNFKIDYNDIYSIFLSVVNTDYNKKNLENIPHIKFQDISIIYRFLVTEDRENIVSFILTNEILNKSLIKDISLNELYDTALSNTIRLFGITVRPLTMTNSNPSNTNIIKIDKAEKVHVVTNQYGIYGANLILINKIFEEIASEINHDLYIIPSSIHELLVMPYDGQINVYKEMLKNINSNFVDSKDILSNNIYHYRRSRKQVITC